MLFLKATRQQSNKIVKILRTYGDATVQQVNFTKPKISFSTNVDVVRKEAQKEILGIREVEKHECYLGLPTMASRSKKAIFQQVKDRIWKKLKGWKEKSLSPAEKEVLIKSVIAQSIPTYVMFCFKIPGGICEDIRKKLCKFWWDDTEQAKKTHWLSWSRLCRAKRRGGMGFRDLKAFNSASLARQGWRLIQDPDTLIACLLRAKYHPRSSFLEAQIGYCPSFTWRSIFSASIVVGVDLLGHLEC